MIGNQFLEVPISFLPFEVKTFVVNETGIIETDMLGIN